MASKKAGSQAKQALDNLNTLAKSNGFKMEDIIKTNVFLTDMDYFNEVNQVYSKYFKIMPPARSMVAVK